MSRYLFASHDGYGLGHVRRNVLIARQVLRCDPDAQVTLVTGVPGRPAWLLDPRFTVIGAPPLLKDARGVYDNPGPGLHAAVAERARIFGAAVAAVSPDVVLVDRHPYGTAGELRAGLRLARAQGARILLGLPDVLGDPTIVCRELAGEGWSGVPDLFHGIVVYGGPALCDHEREYGLPMRPAYCGWVVEPPLYRPRDPDLVVIGGGGRQGQAVVRLGLEAVRRQARLRGVVAGGPGMRGRADRIMAGDRSLTARVRLTTYAGTIGHLLPGAGAAVLSAEYNGTIEALSAGLRPVLVPRRRARREQAIRAARLAALDLANVVSETASPDEVAGILDRPSLLGAGACERAGIRMGGATVAAQLLTSGVPARAS
jgi:predicted glycosyltransferase